MALLESSDWPDPGEAFEPEHEPEAMTPLIVALRERTRRVLLGELDRSLRGKLRHLKLEEREALRTMVEAATDGLMQEPSTRLKAKPERPQAPAMAALVRALFGLVRAA